MGVRLIEDGRGALEFSTGYMDKAFRDPGEIIDGARKALRGVRYDTLVGTGMSGAVIVPTLARALRKKFLIVRKDEDTMSSHSNLKWVGELGKRWVFVDDFISGGGTYARVRDGVQEAAEFWRKDDRPILSWDEEGARVYGESTREPFETTHVGNFMYAFGDGEFTRWEHAERIVMSSELERVN